MILKEFSHGELKHLVDSQNRRCVSIYLPTATSGPETMEGPIRLKGLLKDARKRLEQSGLREDAADAVLSPATELLGESPFWQMQDAGLALFLSSGFFAGYQLPYSVEPRSLVSTGFHLKPMLPVLSNDGQFLILAVSRNSVKLFRASRHTIEEIVLRGVVTSQAEALKYDDPEKNLQVHSGSGGQQTGIIHGHGAAREGTKERTLRFFQKLSSGLHDYLKHEHAPLLLASVDYYLPLLREACGYPHLVDEVLSGNPDDTSAEELREAGWKLVEPIFKEKQRKSREAVEAGLAADRATVDLEKGVGAACHGRADICFLALDREVWGEFDDKTAKIRRIDPSQFGARDLLDLAAVQTVLQGGEVYPVREVDSVPGNSGPLAVLLRY